MIVVGTRQGTLAGKIRHGRAVVFEGQRNMLDERDPEVRELLLRRAGTDVIVFPGHESALADVGLQVLENGRVIAIEKRADATKRDLKAKS